MAKTEDIEHIFGVDISEDELLGRYPDEFVAMLKDHTTSPEGGQTNIFWATHDYEHLGKGYEFASPILPKLITGEHGNVIMPRVALKTFETQKEAQNFFKYATSEIIRFAFLLTDESLTSLAYKVPDLIDYTDANGLVDYSKDVNTQLYDLFGIDEKNQKYIKEVLATRPI